MDSIDLQIAKLLLVNCRITYRDIGNKLNLSVNAIYKRVQNMIESGLIRAFTARPSLIGLNAINVLIFGQSEKDNITDVSNKLGTHENIYFVGNAGGNFLYIDGYLREISELNKYIDFISNIAILNKYTTCLRDLPFRTNPEALSKLDFQILKLIAPNARLPITEIAQKLDSTVTIINYRIKKLIRSGIIQGFRANIDPYGRMNFIQ